MCCIIIMGVSGLSLLIESIDSMTISNDRKMSLILPPGYKGAPSLQSLP